MFDKVKHIIARAKQRVYCRNMAHNKTFFGVVGSFGVGKTTAMKKGIKDITPLYLDLLILWRSLRCKLLGHKRGMVDGEYDGCIRCGQDWQRC